MLTIAAGTPDDLHDLNTFVAASIRDAITRPGLTAEEIAANDRIAASTASAAVDHQHRAIFVAKADGILAGFVIVDRSPVSGRPGESGEAAMPEIDWQIVAPDWQGKGVPGRLMEQALEWIGAGVLVQLGVSHLNERAIAFYKKWGFAETGRIVGRHRIPRRLMIRANLCCVPGLAVSN